MHLIMGTKQMIMYVVGVSHTVTNTRLDNKKVMSAISPIRSRG